jgi:hypothetical protein
MTYHLLIDEMCDKSGGRNAHLFVISSVTFAELNDESL